MDDVIVIGAGPAGLAAANYTAHHHLKTRVIAPDLAGKAAYRLWLPWMHEHESITGEETVERLRQQLLDAPQATRYMDSVEQVFRHDNAFQVHTTEGGVFDSQTVIVATGVSPRALGVPGEQRLMGYGVTYSAVSYAPLFAGRRVVVVGDNLRALRAAAELRTITEHVTLVAPESVDVSGFRLGQRLLEDQRVTVLIHHKVVEIVGERYVSGLVVAGPDGTRQQLPADGVFIEHGLIAHTGFVGTLVERTPSGHIVVDDQCATRCAGLFAAGDITSTAGAEQILIALGEGVKAGVAASTYLREVALIHKERAR
jgi:alkyl hydroperoxide reductase subunit F